MMENTLGGELRAARKQRGWRLVDVASRVREKRQPMSNGFLCDLEHNRKYKLMYPPDEVIKALAKVLELDADWLLYLAGRMPRDIIEARLGEKQVRKWMATIRRVIAIERGEDRITE